jgi:PAS domain S-box-containing protein
MEDRSMKEDELYQILEGAAEAAFVVSSEGTISFWNKAAENLFGLSIKDALSRNCVQVIAGEGSLGERICVPDCHVLEMARRGVSVPCFESQIKTGQGARRWVSTSILVAPVSGGRRLAVHLVRDIDAAKRLEQVTRGFLVEVGSLTGRQVEELLHPVGHSQSQLTLRETEVLKLVAAGWSSKALAHELKVSTVTVRNHLQRILKKLSVHSRLEAVLAARREGWI